MIGLYVVMVLSAFAAIVVVLARFLHRDTSTVAFSASQETVIPKGFVLMDIEGRRYRTRSKLNLKPGRVDCVTIERI